MNGHVNYLLNWSRYFKAPKLEVCTKKPIDKYFLKSHIIMDENRIKTIISNQKLLSDGLETVSN